MGRLPGIRRATRGLRYRSPFASMARRLAALGAAAAAALMFVTVAVPASLASATVRTSAPGSAAVASGRPVSGHPHECLHLTVVECNTDNWLFGISLAEFQSIRNGACKGHLPDCDNHASKDGKEVNWSSDGCSLKPNLLKKYGQNPFGWPYRKACERHDFGYRNYIGQGRCTNKPKGGTRKEIDQQFKYDLDNYVCPKHGGHLRCLALANVYYQAVRKFGRCKQGAQ